MKNEVQNENRFIKGTRLNEQMLIEFGICIANNKTQCKVVYVNFTNKCSFKNRIGKIVHILYYYFLESVRLQKQNQKFLYKSAI